MELPGNTAVIDGRIFPVLEWSVSAEHDVEKVSTNRFSPRTSNVAVTNRTFEGKMMLSVGALPTEMTMKPMHDIYLFPKSGTKDRMVLTDAIFSSVSYSQAGQTTRLEFVAKHLEQ